MRGRTRLGPQPIRPGKGGAEESVGATFGMTEAATIEVAEDAGPPPVQLVFEKVSIEVTPPHGPLSRAPPVKRILRTPRWLLMFTKRLISLACSSLRMAVDLPAPSGPVRMLHGTRVVRAAISWS